VEEKEKVKETKEKKELYAFISNKIFQQIVKHNNKKRKRKKKEKSIRKVDLGKKEQQSLCFSST